jgi:hypothetical protein
MKPREGNYTRYEGIEIPIVGYYEHGISHPETDKHRQIANTKEFGILQGFQHILMQIDSYVVLLTQEARIQFQ